MFDPVALPDTIPAPVRRRDPATRRWVERLDRFRQAGQTIAAFCAAEGVSVPAF
jgi:transposase